MRFLVGLLLLSGFIAAAQPPADVGPPRFSLGLGLVVSDNAYAGQDRELLPIPLITYRCGGFHFQGIRAAYDFLQHPRQALTLAIQPRFESFAADDAEVSRACKRARNPSTSGWVIGAGLVRRNWIWTRCSMCWTAVAAASWTSPWRTGAASVAGCGKVAWVWRTATKTIPPIITVCAPRR